MNACHIWSGARRALVAGALGAMIGADLSAMSGAPATPTAYPEWRRLGPGGGGVIMDVVPHPTDPSIVWVQTDLTGIFRSRDGGRTFERKSGPVERQELLYEWMRGMDNELAFDPTDPNVLYWAMDGGIYTHPGLYRSTDGGDTWDKMPGSPDLMPGAIAVDHAGVIYGIKHRRLYVSEDRGTNWQERPDLPTEYCGDPYDWRRRYRVIIRAGRNQRVFIGDRLPGTGLYFTNDRGRSWTQALAGEQILDFSISPTTPDLVFALEQDGRVFRSTDGGRNFNVVAQVEHGYYNRRVWPPFYGGIAVNPDDHVITIGREQMALSTDGGLTFRKYGEQDPVWNAGDYIFTNRRTNHSLFKVIRLAASPASGRWYTVDGHVLRITEDDGKSWRAGVAGIDILCAYSPPAIDSTDPRSIHLGAGDNGHYYTRDEGVTWRSSESRMCNIDGVAQDPNHPDVWYKLYGGAGDQGGFYRSTNGGADWVKIGKVPLPGLVGRTEENPSFLQGWIGRVCIDPTDSRRIYVVHRASGGVYRSTDGGETFACVLKLELPWELSVTRSGMVLVCTFDGKGLYRSVDRGDSFEEIHHGMVHNFAVHPQNDDIIYANVGSWSHAWAAASKLPRYERGRAHPSDGPGRLFKTTDGGKTWKEQGAYDGFALYIEPNYPDVMLMATREGGRGILRSMDGGATWSSFHGDHGNYLPHGFVYGGVPGRVYTWNHNLFRADGIHLVKQAEGKSDK
jgi:photosystem II stability/assembly factor-like uncharacterized protein